MFKLRSILEIDFILETQKYAWRRLSKLMYLSLNSEEYFKQTFNIDVFILKLWNILEVDFLNLWIYLQTQKYIWSRFPKYIYIFFQTQKYTSFQKKWRSINKVLLKYKESAFLFFSVFILRLYFLLGSSLKAYFYWTSMVRYTSHIVFFCKG